MPKMTIAAEARRAELEDSLAQLANARKRIELVNLRVMVAIERSGLEAVLNPALDELSAVDRRIAGAQAGLRGLWLELQPGD